MSPSLYQVAQIRWGCRIVRLVRQTHNCEKHAVEQAANVTPEGQEYCEILERYRLQDGQRCSGQPEACL